MKEYTGNDIYRMVKRAKGGIGDAMYDDFRFYLASEVDDDRAKDKEEIARLRKALISHRADLHCYSSRPCPTCRESAEVLGISDKVPYSCAREESDREALAEKE